MFYLPPVHTGDSAVKERLCELAKPLVDEAKRGKAARLPDILYDGCKQFEGKVAE